MRIARLLVIFTGVFLLLGAAWLALYSFASSRSADWKARLVQELGDRGLHVSLRSLELDWRRGVRFRDLRIYRGPERQQLVARCDSLFAAVDLGALLSGTFQLETLELEEGSLTFPLALASENEEPLSPATPRLKITDIAGRVHLQAEHADLAFLRGNYRGINLLVEGRLDTRPVDGRPSDQQDQQDPDSLLHALRALDSTLASSSFPEDSPPQLHLVLRGHPSSPEKWQARADLQSGPFTLAGHEIQSLRALARLESGLLRLPEVSFTDQVGQCLLQGRYHLPEKRLVYTGSSSADLVTLFQALDLPWPDSLQRLAFLDVPKLALDGTQVWGPHPSLQLTAEVHLGAFRLDEQDFQSLRTTFSRTDERFFVSDFSLIDSAGSLQGKARWDGEQLRLQAESTLPLDRFLPLFRLESTKRFIRRWEFNPASTAHFTLSATGPSLHPDSWLREGTIDFRNFGFNQKALDSFTASFTDADRLLTLEEVSLDYTETRSQPRQSLTADSIEYDSRASKTTIRGARGRVQPQHLVTTFYTKGLDALEDFPFDSPPQVQFSGAIAPQSPSETALEIDFQAPRTTLRYQFLGKTLPLDEPRGRITIQGEAVRAEKLAAKIFQGELRGSFQRTGRPDERSQQKGDFRLSQAAYGDIARTYEFGAETSGTLDGNFRWTRGESLDSLLGQGQVAVRRGNLFTIPLLGPLSRVISTVLPPLEEMANSEVREATSDFTIAKGRLATQDFRALTNMLKIEGEGTVDLETQEIDFNMRANARGMIGTGTYLVSELLRYRGKGTLKNQQWRPLALEPLEKLPIIGPMFGRESAEPSRERTKNLPSRVLKPPTAKR
ncbi:MAG: AsmA-like C-terminal region-containing protein [Verrucomicrobiota bacterium]